MFTRRCVRCGSTSFRADRSLGGRLVCSHCGIPADQQGRRSSSGGRLSGATTQRAGGLWFWILLALIAFVLVVMFQSA
jgi:ribosomal protein L37E